MSAARSAMLSRSRLLVVVCAVVWVVCAIKPWDYEAWLLEQLATLCALLVLAWCWFSGVRFSYSAQFSIALLFVVHTTGTHFTYSLTPYDEWTSEWFGFSINAWFGWDRNNYDRLVHLLYGVLLAQPIAQALVQRMALSPFRARFFGFHLITSTSAVYELVEWVAALIFGSDLGNLYLGTQGDEWDAQADIALASAGCVAVYLAVAVSEKYRRSVSQAAP